MRVAVTGATGFIGRHVLPLLKNKGHEIIAVVRNKTKALGLGDGYDIVEHEIGNETTNTYNKLGRPDILIHLAWGGLPNYKSLHHIDDELPTHYRFIKYMAESGVKNIAVVGTCFEYGMQSGMLSEDMEAKPNNPYGYAKDALRKQIQFLQKEFYFNFVWMRLFYMYGEDQTNNALYSQIRKAIKNGDNIFNMSGGEQLRDYLYIGKVAECIIELSCAEKDIGVVNVCSGVPISIRRLVEQWRDKNGWDIELNLGYYPYPDYEPFAFWGNDNYMKSLLSS